MAWIEKITGSLEQKKEYRQYKVRVRALPESYRQAAQALERYFMYCGGISQGDVLMKMCDDLAALFEEAAANDTPIRDIVGDDPVSFAETFLANYTEGGWQRKERERLVAAIARAAQGPDVRS